MINIDIKCFNTTSLTFLPPNPSDVCKRPHQTKPLPCHFPIQIIHLLHRPQSSTQKTPCPLSGLSHLETPSKHPRNAIKPPSKRHQKPLKTPPKAPQNATKILPLIPHIFSLKEKFCNP